MRKKSDDGPAMKPRRPRQVREPVAWFAEMMENKLKANDHKGRTGWVGCGQEYLLGRLVEEVEELVEAGRRGRKAEILLECFDVANFAMMLADTIRLMSGKRP